MTGLFLALMAGTVSAQGITSGAVSVTEGDTAAVEAGFRYSFPAGSARSYEFAVIPVNLRPGVDFAPFRQTLTAAVGTALEGTVPVPVLPDLTEEENGSLSLVVRGPEAADWAASLGPPVTVNPFNAAHGGGEVLYWGDDKVVGARMRPDGAGSEVVTWERTAAGGLVPRSSIPLEGDLAFGAQVNASTVVLPVGTTLKIWLQAADNLFAWQPAAMDLVDAQAAPRLFEDRLSVMNWNGVNKIYRRDPAAGTGWRETGQVGRGSVAAMAKDFAVVNAGGAITVWERIAGTEDFWDAVYEIRPAFTARVMATAPGMLVLAGPAGLEIHERAAGVWGKAATLPVTPPATEDRRISVAVAGDWIAVGEGATVHSGGAGTVRLFLRSATDRAVWNPAGRLTGPGEGYGGKLIWNGLELVSSGVIAGQDGGVVIRRFQGATTTVVDDDRFKLSLTTFTLREPVSGSAVREVLAELPLPADSPMRVDYEILPGTALAGVNFVPASGRATIPAGVARVPVPVTLLAQTALEPAKTLRVRLVTAGQPPVTGEVKILESGPPAVVASSASQLIEGQGGGTVTIRQTPAAGGPPPALPAEVRIFAGGFKGTPFYNWFPATPGVDLPSVRTTCLLDSGSPTASLTVTATDDTMEDVPENQIAWPENLTSSDEQVKVVYDGLGPERNAGSFGIAYNGNIPAQPADASGGLSMVACTAGPEWCFVSWGSGYPNRRGMLAFHRWDSDKEIQADADQVIDSDGDVPFSKLSYAGGTLLHAFYREAGGQGRCVVRLYEAIGEAGAPWRKTAEWSVSSPRIPDARINARFIDADQILLDDCLLLRAGGKWGWRLAASGIWRAQDADLDRLVRWNAVPPGSFSVLHRLGMGQPDWTAVQTFPANNTPRSYSDVRIKGRTLVAKDSSGYLDIWREDGNGGWGHEQALAQSYGSMVRIEESTIVMWDRIFHRTGPPSAPWIEGEKPPGAMQAFEAMPEGGIFVSVPDWPGVSSRRLQILWPGTPLSIYDDESLKFSVREWETVNESWFGEAIRGITLEATRPLPFPVDVRVRSRDRGSAVAGVDYVPFDQVVTFLPDQPYFGNPARILLGVPLRVMGDRLPEDTESFDVVLDPPSFGYAEEVAQVWLADPYSARMQVTAATTTMLEPASGTRTQAVEFVLETAMSQDTPFSAKIFHNETATPGVDFMLPTDPVILKAGSTRLRVPVTVPADDFDEGQETFRLTVTGNLGTSTFQSSARVVIMDSMSPGVMADGYSGSQGAAMTVDSLSGLAANDPSPWPGSYSLTGSPGWGTVTVRPDGSFTAIPGPNVTGPVSFMARAELVPFHQYLDSDVVWKYLHPMDGIDPGAADSTFRNSWKTLDFDDSAWPAAGGTLTYGGFPIPVAGDPVILPTPPSGKRYTDYFRTTFYSDRSVTLPLRLRLHCDDGAVVYINGIERGRAQTSDSVSFSTLPDTYTMVTGGAGQTEEMEVAPQTVEMRDVPLLAGTNILAISLHNNNSGSSDLGLRLMTLEAHEVSDPVPVTIDFADALIPPAGVADVYDCPQNAEFRSSDHYGWGLLDNDGLLSPSGQDYDPVLGVTASAVSVGTLVLDGITGHFTYTPPPDFSGAATFTYRIRDKDGLSAPVPVTLNVKPMLPFDVWKAEALSAGVGGAEDTDGDGVSNFMEYALGTDPAASVTGDGHGFMAEPGGKLRLMVRRASDLAWQLQSADSPETTEWSTVLEGRGLDYQTPPHPGIVSESNGSNSLILRITFDPGVSGRRFYRLKAFRIPPPGE